MTQPEPRSIEHASIQNLREIVRLQENANRALRNPEGAGMPRRIALEQMRLYLLDPHCTFLLARSLGVPIGCAAIRRAKSNNMYIKYWAFDSTVPNPSRVNSIDMIRYFLDKRIAEGHSDILFLGDLRNKSYLPVLEKFTNKLGYNAEICVSNQSRSEQKLYGICPDAIRVSLKTSRRAQEVAHA